MISSAEALKIILNQQFPSSSKSVPLRDTKGMLLAEDIYADRDFPPFHRVTMDGIALKFKTWEAGKRSFLVQGIQAAGEPQKTLESEDHAIEIMTGAVLPIDADLVVKVEELEFDVSNGIKSVTILSSGLTQFKNVHLQGSDNQQGDLLINKGAKIIQ
jgi:molybdopterin molybdotransferase